MRTARMGTGRKGTDRPKGDNTEFAIAPVRRNPPLLEQPLSVNQANWPTPAIYRDWSNLFGPTAPRSSPRPTGWEEFGDYSSSFVQAVLLLDERTAASMKAIPSTPS